MTASGMRSAEMRKKRRLLSVWAPHSRSAGTSIGPKLSFSMRVPAMPTPMLLRLGGDLGVHLRHIERLGLRDHLLERRGRQRARLLKEDHFLAKHHQRRDRADAEGAGEFLLVVSVHLGEDDVRMRLRRVFV